MILRSLSTLLLLTSAWSISTAQEVEQLSFRDEIRPLLSDKCFACHGPDAETRAADLRLDVAEEADWALSPGDVAESEVVRRIRSSDPDEMMPPPEFKNRLESAEIERITKWIEQGAPYDAHWSFVPLGPSQPPTDGELGDLASWSRNPLDRFVLKKLVAQGMSPSSEASPAQWLRRVSFDLTGLPPTREEIEAFLADDSDQAYERVVDRLLASSAYGERMANQWLDVARYSDSYGYQVDRERYVWPWRDWVIQAYNDNLPYDQFLTWQIAGDLLPDATHEQRLATTFCRLHPQKVEGGSVPEEFRVEYVADRTHTLATAFLGLTLECARCHEHKYDPITQKEYYQLFAYFNSIDEAGLYSFFTQSVPTPTLPLPTDQQQERLTTTAARVTEAEAALADHMAAASNDFQTWLDALPETLPESLLAPKPLEAKNFEDPIGGANQQVPGKVGQAIRLTGDDGFGLSVGNFKRSQPFTISLWLKTPDHKDRSVVFHRSRAWTDAGSRGYELLIEDGRLKWSLIHFWPGNAISIQATDPLPLDRWVHVTVTYDGSSTAAGLGMSIDGAGAKVEVVRDALTRQITGGGGDNITIGERFRDRGFTQGEVDEFHVYDRRLSRLEIAALALNDEITTGTIQPTSDLSAERLADLRQLYLLSVDPRASELREEVRAARDELNTLRDQITEIMVMEELPQPRPTFVLARGSYQSPTEPVVPAPPAFLTQDQPSAANRLGLAQWLTRPDHPLTARVATNRLWQLCFGYGLVRTPEDFGSQGEAPTHPELLNWLSWQFVESGWDQKALLKQIVLSSTYRQSSRATPELWQVDPENRLLARGPRHRLPAEMIRDGFLYATGIMDMQIGGPPVKPYEVAASFKPLAHAKDSSLYRRSLYTYWKRTAPAPVMLALDASKRDVCTVRRERTASPLQSLVLMNDPQLIEAARFLAQEQVRERGADTEGILTDVFYRFVSRPPSADEIEVLTELVTTQLARFESDTEAAQALLAVGEKPVDDSLPAAQVAAWTVVFNTLMNYDEAIVKR